MRIREHVNSIKDGDVRTPIGRYAAKHHCYNPKTVKFYALEHIHLTIRGDVSDTLLLQLEARWTYVLKATRSPGLNENLSYKFFYKSNHQNKIWAFPPPFFFVCLLVYLDLSSHCLLSFKNQTQFLIMNN